MGKTSLNVLGESFLINGKPVYSDLGQGKMNGTLMNARFIQGVFDDAADRRRFDRYGRVFDADDNTNALIKALPQWKAYGLRAVTVGLQGGWPVFTTDVATIDNNPFGSDGLRLDGKYAARMDRIIRAADELGMVVIVNFLYWAQARRLQDGLAILSAVKSASAFLREGGYGNVIIDVANEYDISFWSDHPLVNEPEGMQVLIAAARKESGGLLTGSSSGGGMIQSMVADASDVVLIHGNGLTMGEYHSFVGKARSLAHGKPVLCNEDCPCVSRLDVAAETRTSWGHYDNFTKQEPPCDWSVTPGQDFFFARRMAQCVGIATEALPLMDQFYLQGLEPANEYQGNRWIRLACERPEAVDRVEFRLDGQLVDTSYDEPFFLFGETTWIQKGWRAEPSDRLWQAVVFFKDGSSIVKEAAVPR